jgi:NAD(P)H-hydrate epimerase
VYRAVLGNDSRGDEPPEILFKTIPSRHSYFDEISLDSVLVAAKESSVVILGPGLGRAEGTLEFVRGVIRELAGSGVGLVLDADGLGAIQGDLSMIAGFSDDSLVITPHPGEMSRILGITTEEVQLDRYSAARDATKKVGGSVVLKGASSIIYTQHGGFVNLTGNPFMASAGMGDVLAGVIGALMAQGMKGYEAAKLGVFLHASSGDMAYERTGGPIVASDVVDCMPLAIGDLRRGLV